LFRFALLGLGLGGIYAVSSLGLVLVYRGSGVLNFAQGAVAGLGAYAFWELHYNHDVPTPVALILALIACALVGALMHYVVMRPLITAPPLSRVIATLGVMAALQALGDIRYGQQTHIINSFLPTDRVKIFGATVTSDRLILVGIALVLTILLWAVYKFTRFGLATTAVAENEQTAQLCGHSPNTIALTNWMLGSMLAGLAGILVVPISGLTVDTLVLLIVPMLAASLIGGFSSFPITFVAAVVMGIIQSEMAKYVSTPGWQQSVPFLLVIVILIVRGRPLPVRSHVNERLPDIGSAIIRPVIVLPVLAAAVVLILVLPLSWSPAMISSLLFATVCVSVVITTGYAGQLSLAQFALAGFAGFVATRLAATQNWPFLLCAGLGVIAAVPVGFLVGLPAVRTRGVNLAIITFGLAYAMQNVIFDAPTFTGGVNGTTIKSPSVFGLSLDSFEHPRRYAFAALIALALALLIASNIRRGRGGRRLVAVRSNERAAASLGLSVAKAKLFAFSASAGVAGLAGVLLAYENTYVQYSSFDVFSSVNAVIGSVLGGVGYLAGALIGGSGATGGITARIVNVFTSNGNVGLYVSLALGLLLVVTLIANPDGIASFISRGGKVGVMGAAPKRGRRSKQRTPAAGEHIPATETVQAIGPIASQLSPQGNLPVAAAVRAPRDVVRPRRLVVDRLSVRFGAVTALEDISLTVEPGTVVGLMGPNGAGKTTLIDAVTGFVSASSGTVSIDGGRIDSYSAARRAIMGVRRTFQSLELFEEVSVSDNIRVAIEADQQGAYWRDLIRPRRAALTSAAEAAISVLGLTGDLERRPSELPLGRRRLVAIARAIASEPSILLLDEPAAGLDEDETRELGVLIRSLANDWGLGILLVEHDVPLLMSVCDTLVAIDHGQFVTTGAPQEVRHHPQVVASYLGTETEELVNAPIESAQQ
jgi:ABC-type branched-subunit amino acid transport system permease subunit/ABC-type branched-subunit amino acid transport system ATPase component